MSPELKSLSFPSATSILKWAGKSQIEYLQDNVFYVEKDAVFYYFSKSEHDNKYYLVMQSEKNLGEKNDGFFGDLWRFICRKNL